MVDFFLVLMINTTHLLNLLFAIKIIRNLFITISIFLTYSSVFQYFSYFDCDDFLAWVYLLKNAAENLLRKQYVNVSIFSPLGFKSVFVMLHSKFSFDAATFLYTIYVFNIVIFVKNYLYLNFVPIPSEFYAVDFLKFIKYPAILFCCYLGKYNDAFTFWNQYILGLDII